VAPTVPYGVTDFARGFSGAIGISAPVLTQLLSEVAAALLREGFSHVCVVNNHLEPAQAGAVRAVLATQPRGAISVACPLARRWARTLSDEFKRGNCHAGRYETSLVMAAGQSVSGHDQLEGVDISLSDGILAGKMSFLEMGMTRAYTGRPHEATSAEGESLYERLVTMTVTEVLEGLEQRNIA
jgi:creatinine amidohydrolase